MEQYLKKQIIGLITTELAMKCKIPEYANKFIVIYENDRRHCEKRHSKDFKNIAMFNYVMNNLDKLIKTSDFYFFNPKNSTLEYYKKIEENITIRVKIEPGNEMKVKTVFPINEEKYINKLNKSKYNEYVINWNE